MGAASFCVSEPPSSAVCHAGGASGQGLGPERAGAAVPGAQGEDAETEERWNLVGDGQAWWVEEQGALSGLGREKAGGYGRGERDVG